MASVSLPLGAVLSPFVEKISKYFFESTLSASHNSYMEWHNSYDNWKSLNDQVDVSILAPHALDNQKSPLVKLAFKLSKGADEIEPLSLFVESSGTYLNYQDSISVRNLKEKVVVVSLPSAPLRSLDISENGQGVLFTLRKIEISKINENGSLSEDKVHFDFSNVDLLNDRFIKKWDFFWNMRAIDRAYNKIKGKLRYYLITPKVYYTNCKEIPAKETIKGLLRFFIGRPLYWLLSRDFLIRSYFWVPIFLKKKKLDVSGKNVYLDNKDNNKDRCSKF